MSAEAPPARGHSILRVLTVAWLALQVAVPAYALAQPRPARMGWQMYTAVTDLPVVSVQLEDGSVQEIDIRPLVARDRAEADYLPALRAALCARLGVVSVITLHAGRREVTQCR